MVHKSNGAEMDSSDTFHSTNIRDALMGVVVIFQQGKLLRIFFHSTRLLRGFCNIQFLVVVLRVSRRRRKHYVWDKGKTHKVKLPLRHLLSRWKNLHHWILEILQASYATVLPRQTRHGICNNIPTDLRALSRRRLVPGRWIHLHHYYLQHQRIPSPLRTLPLLLRHEGFTDAVRPRA